jgi:pilus assembly protein Flp/PilA
MINYALAVTKLHSRQRGLTTVEYAIAGGLVVAGIIGAFLLLGTNVSGLLKEINDALK